MEFLWFETLPSVAVAILAAAIVTSIVLKRQRNDRGLPGPSRFSTLVAFLLHFEDFMHYREKWRIKFGNVYLSRLGRLPEVVMTDYDIIHDAFVLQADNCSSRPKNNGGPLLGLAGKGIVSSPDWKEQRKFALTVLREQGMGKMDMEPKIMEEVDAFTKEMERGDGAPMQIESLMHSAISNIICNLVLGSRFDYDDKNFNGVLNKFLDQFRLVRRMAAIDSVPFLKWLPGDFFGYHACCQSIREVKQFFASEIRQHAQKLDPNHPKDFIDSYLTEIQKSEISGRQTSFDESNCLAAVLQLFLAGTDTTANTLMWSWLFMILHPEVQAKVQLEIAEKIGSRLPSLKDRLNMPYSEAVLTEILRLANTAINSIPHRAERDMMIGGYLIPKDYILTSSLADVHLDENSYPNPKQFIPARYLGPDGSFVKPKKFIPFGIGRRVCVGESLARAELFLFFISVLQQFKLEVPKGCTVKAEGKTRPVHKPNPYSIVFKKRTAVI